MGLQHRLPPVPALAAGCALLRRCGSASRSVESDRADGAACEQFRRWIDVVSTTAQEFGCWQHVDDPARAGQCGISCISRLWTAPIRLLRGAISGWRGSHSWHHGLRPNETGRQRQPGGKVSRTFTRCFATRVSSTFAASPEIFLDRLRNRTDIAVIRAMAARHRIVFAVQRSNNGFPHAIRRAQQCPFPVCGGPRTEAKYRQVVKDICAQRSEVTLSDLQQASQTWWLEWRAKQLDDTNQMPKCSG